MAEERDILTADLKAAADMPASRLSEITRALAIRGRATHGGTTLSQFTVEEAVRIVLTRRLQALGLALGEAAKAVRTVTSAHLKQTILDDQPRWLVVSAAGAELCNGDQMLDLAEGRGGALIGLRIVRVDAALRDIFTAKLERLRAMEKTTETETIVTGYAAPQGATGCFLHSDLRLCTFQNGRGLAVRLTPEAARSLAAQLLSTADALEAAPRPEDIN